METTKKQNPIVFEHYRAATLATRSQTAVRNSMPSRTESLAVALFSQLYQLALQNAKTVAELAGYGGRM